MFAAGVTLVEPFRLADVKLPGVRNLFTRGVGWALALSMLLHLLLFLAPAWQVPALDELFANDPPVIDARLARPVMPRPVARRAAHRAHSEAAPPSLPQTGVEASSVPTPAGTADAPPVDDAVKVPLPVTETPPTEPAGLPAAVPDVAFALPHHGRIRFSVAKGEDGFVLGKTTHEWQHDSHTYSMTGTTETTGIAALFRPVKIVQTSAGGFARGELMPHEFRDDRGDGTVNTANFDWDKLQVTLNGQQQVSIAGGAQDLLSMFYQLTQAAMRGEGFEMAIATGRKVERYAFEWLDEEDVAVRAGKYHAWHVRVHAVSGGKDITEVWLGQEVAGLPVRIRQVDRKGGIVDLQAEEIDYEGK